MCADKLTDCTLAIYPIMRTRSCANCTATLRVVVVTACSAGGTSALVPMLVCTNERANLADAVYEVMRRASSLTNCAVAIVIIVFAMKLTNVADTVCPCMLTLDTAEETASL